MNNDLKKIREICEQLIQHAKDNEPDSVEELANVLLSMLKREPIVLEQPADTDAVKFLQDGRPYVQACLNKIKNGFNKTEIITPQEKLKLISAFEAFDLALDIIDRQAKKIKDLEEFVS
jgi:hypothetical protein